MCICGFFSENKNQKKIIMCKAFSKMLHPEHVHLSDLTASYASPLIIVGSVALTRCSYLEELIK